MKNSKWNNIAVISLLIGFTTFGFQNCSQVGFENSIPSTALIDLSSGLLPNFQCQSVIEIPMAAALQIPAQDQNGVCYALKIMDAIALGPSTLNPGVESGILSRDHGGSSNPRDAAAPYVMSHVAFDIRMLGPRKIKLTGSLDDQTPIKIDNYAVVGMYPANLGDSTDVQYFKAYGSSDSLIADSGEIEFYGQPIDFQAFATGGTSTVAPLDLSGLIRLNTDYRLDVRALDCGGSRELSDIYVLFQ